MVPLIVEAALTRTRRSPTEGNSISVERPAESGSPRQLAAAKSTAASAGDGRRPGHPARGHSPANSVEQMVGPAAIERALSIYQQLQERERSVVVQARKILTRHIYAMIDQGENDEHRLTVGGLVHLKSVERDHAIKSASNSQNGNTMKHDSSSAHSQSPVERPGDRR